MLSGRQQDAAMAGLGSRLVQHTGEGSAALRSSELKPAPDEPVADPGHLIDELVEPAHIRPRRQEQDRCLVAIESLAERHGHELPGDPSAVWRVAPGALVPLLDEAVVFLREVLSAEGVLPAGSGVQGELENPVAGIEEPLRSPHCSFTEENRAGLINDDLVWLGDREVQVAGDERARLGVVIDGAVERSGGLAGHDHRLLTDAGFALGLERGRVVQGDTNEPGDA